MHAWGWGSAARLAAVREHLHPRATYWDLHKRGLEQLKQASAQ